MGYKLNPFTGNFDVTGSGSGVSSVSNADGSITASPTTGAVDIQLNVAHANTWTGIQTFKTDAVAYLSIDYIVALGGFLINVGVSTLIFKSGGDNPSNLLTNVIAPGVGVASAFLWDFLGYKFVVFRKKG